jgi:uncharacterized damage-inducible protein DinB
MSTLLQKLYGYHTWANKELFDKLGTVNQDKHRAEVDAGLRLISHYYVVAQIFAAHLTGVRHQ